MSFENLCEPGTGSVCLFCCSGCKRLNILGGMVSALQGCQAWDETARSRQRGNGLACVRGMKALALPRVRSLSLSLSRAGVGLCELVVFEGALGGCWHSWGYLWQACFSQGAGLGGRVGQTGCLLDSLCATAFQRGCCKAHPQVL